VDECKPLVAGARGATAEQVGAAAAAADAMLLHDYHPLDIKNPTLGRHYKAWGYLRRAYLP